MDLEVKLRHALLIEADLLTRCAIAEHRHLDRIVTRREVLEEVVTRWRTKYVEGKIHS